MWKQVNGIWVYIPRHFTVHEFFSPEMINLVLGKHPEEYDLLWTYMNAKTTMTADLLREKYGTAIMNTYHMKPNYRAAYGTHKYRGFRPRNCETGSNLSQHKMGCAADIVFLGVDAGTVRREILSDPWREEFQFITFLEMGVSWLHFDCRPRDKFSNGIYKYIP